MSRTLYVGPVTQDMEPSQPNWDTKLGRRKGKMSSKMVVEGSVEIQGTFVV
jgi:hypothetical protein